MNTDHDEPAHIITDDFDGRCEPKSYWRKFLRCSDGAYVIGAGDTKEQAEQDAQRKRVEQEKYLALPDFERLKKLTSKGMHDMSPNDVWEAVTIMAKSMLSQRDKNSDHDTR